MKTSASAPTRPRNGASPPSRSSPSSATRCLLPPAAEPMKFRPAFPALVFALGQSLSAATPPLRFDFGAGPPAEGWTRVAPDTVYTPSLGYGLVSGSGVSAVTGEIRPGRDALRADALVGARPFSFVLDLPEGNYEVVVLLGDP